MKEAKEKLEALLLLLNLEKSEEEKLFTKNLTTIPIKERVQQELTLYPLKFFKKAFGLGNYPTVVLMAPSKIETNKFQPGTSVRLFSVLDEGTVKGIVDKIENDSVQLQLLGQDHPDWIEADKLGLDLLHDEYTFKLAEFCINKLIGAEKNRNAELRNVIYGHKKPEISEEIRINPDALLNSSQNRAVARAVNAKDYFIIHGPPGTGKTTTLTILVTELLKTEKQVLVSAPSNVATDLLTHNFKLKGLNVTRIGNPIRISDELIECTLDKKITEFVEFKEIKKLKTKSEELYRLAGKFKRNFDKEAHEERKRLYKESRDLRKEVDKLEKHLIDQALRKSKVITCTLAGADHPFLRNFEFETVIIDEAGQALEPFTLIPITKGNRVIMAGDPFQLPPTVKSDEAVKKGLSSTLLEKLMQKSPELVATLDVQYRMNDVIKEFSNKKFYKNILHSHESVASKTIASDVFPPLEFIDTAGCGFEETVNENTGSILNMGEIDILKKHLASVLDLIPLAEELSIGILSPYREQVAQIKTNMEGFNTAPGIQIRIHTIDSFQGQEADVIYISLVRSNGSGTIGFLKDYRRMNVAMTRAKKKLVIIGDSATLGNDLFYNDFLTYAEQIKGYRTAWEFI